MGRGTDKPPQEYRGFFRFAMKSYYTTAGEIVLLPYDRIISRPVRELDAYKEEALSRLIRSIETNGLLEPIRVSVVDEQYYRIASGERRFRAAVIAGLTEIPCIVMGEELTEPALPYALIDDFHHRSFHYLEQAERIRALLYNEGYTLYLLSETLSVPMWELADKLRLLSLSEEIRKKIRENALPEPFARLLLTVDDAQRRGVLDKILTEDLSLTEAKAYLQAEKEKKRRGKIMVFKDLNVFVNTIDHAVETMNRSGIEANVERIETAEQIDYRITIRKSG